MLEVRLWGNPNFAVDGSPLTARVPPACWSLLALLATEQQPVSRAAIATRLWPEAMDSEALANLRRHLHRLNGALPARGAPWLLADARTVAWNHDAQARVDVVEFQRMLALRRDDEAVAAYAGDLLEGNFDDAVVHLRERLRAAYLEALDRLVARTYAQGDLASALRYAEQLLAAEEWREDTVRSVMAIRYERGDRVGAINVYERFADMLRRELRTAPMPETIALRDAIVDGAPVADSVPKVRIADAELGARFVGRREELRVLRAAWEKAARGRGNTMLLAGEPGIGKSRLALELGTVVESQGGCALVGRTSSPEAAPFQAVIEAVRDGLALLARGDLEEGWLDAVAGVLPEVSRLSEHAGLRESDNEREDPERERSRLREGLVRAIAAIARHRPLLMVLEDVHWAGRDTIDFVEMLANRAAGLPLLLVLTYRPGDIDAKHPLHAVRRELQRTRRGQHVAPARLAKTDLAELARAILGQERPTPELVARLEHISEGNPLFAVQVLRYVAETGDLPGAERALQSIAATVVSRLERLAPEARAIAEVAATIDSDFTSEEIARVGGWEEATVLEALGVLLDAHIVRERGGERFAYGFTHALVQSAIRDVAAPVQRRARHHRIAAVLAQTRAHDPAAAALIAAHWEAAEDYSRAASALLAAAGVAMRRYAWNEAIRLARRAVELGLSDDDRFHASHLVLEAAVRLADVRSVEPELDTLDRLSGQGDERALVALYWRGRVADFKADRAEQRRLTMLLADSARASGNQRWLIEAHLAQAKFSIFTGDYTSAEREASAALAVASEVGDSERRWRAREALVQILFRQGKVDLGKTELDSVRRDVEAGEERGREVLALGLVRLAVSTQDPRVWQEARIMADRLENELGDVKTSLICRSELAYDLQSHWDTAGARAQYQAAIELTQAHGIWQSLIASKNNLGCIERELGHFDRARALWLDVRPAAKRYNALTSISCTSLNLAELELALGNFDVAVKEATYGLRYARKSGIMYDVAEGLVTLGAAECARGERDAGFAHMNEGLALRRSLDTPRFLAKELSMYLEALLDAGDLERATAAAVELRALFDKQPDRQVDPGRIAVALARVAEATGNEWEARKIRARGRKIVEMILARITDRNDRTAFAAKEHNTTLLGAQ
ncbi:MAG: AAA family ATPase [Candidatus Eremiobacteraeota bacterium]|nr:AAA family ATPase [Candidatus Eremiobacteraeota bacterium]